MKWPAMYHYLSPNTFSAEKTLTLNNTDETTVRVKTLHAAAFIRQFSLSTIYNTCKCFACIFTTDKFLPNPLLALLVACIFSYPFSLFTFAFSFQP